MDHFPAFFVSSCTLGILNDLVWRLLHIRSSNGDVSSECKGCHCSCDARCGWVNRKIQYQNKSVITECYEFFSALVFGGIELIFFLAGILGISQCVVMVVLCIIYFSWVLFLGHPFPSLPHLSIDDNYIINVDLVFYFISITKLVLSQDMSFTFPDSHSHSTGKGGE